MDTKMHYRQLIRQMIASGIDTNDIMSRFIRPPEEVRKAQARKEQNRNRQKAKAKAARRRRK